MERRPCMILVGLMLSAIVPMGIPCPADAIPAMSRQTGEPCSTCHDVIPKLNQTGQHFRTNGFRLPDAKERDLGQEKKSAPDSPERRSHVKPASPDKSHEEFREQGAR